MIQTQNRTMQTIKSDFPMHSKPANGQECYFQPEGFDEMFALYIATYKRKKASRHILHILVNWSLADGWELFGKTKREKLRNVCRELLILTYIGTTAGIDRMHYRQLAIDTFNVYSEMEAA